MPAPFDANRRVRTTIIPFRAGDMEQTRHSICHQRSAFPPWQTRPGECHASAVAGKHTRLACSLAISLRALVCVGGKKTQKSSYLSKFPLRASCVGAHTLTVGLSQNKEVIPVNEKVRLTNITDAPGKSQQTFSHRRTNTLTGGGEKSDVYYLWRPLSGFKRCALVNF